MGKLLVLLYNEVCVDFTVVSFAAIISSETNG
jgi:hypothetical protein